MAPCCLFRCDATGFCSPGQRPRTLTGTALSSPTARAVQLQRQFVATRATTTESQQKRATRRKGEGTRAKSRDYWDLITSPESDLPRAKSASDAAVLRRKGHLKEQDKLISFMLSMLTTHTCEEVMLKMDRWIVEHRQDPQRSKLRRMVPSVGLFFTPLRLTEAFREYDSFFSLSRRRYVPPNFAELRHILNMAQVHGIAENLKLVTFDADGTLYADGAHFEQDNHMIQLLIELMRANIHVAIVTAAGYPNQPEKFEQRLAGLLQAFRDQKLPAEVTDRFSIMGGECNYLLRVSHPDKRLEFVAEEVWKTEEMQAWDEEAVQVLLDEAEEVLEEGCRRLCLPVQFIRKPRAVGVVPKEPTIYEVLEELAITVQQQLVTESIPYCAFNGGNDVFVDIGNKSIGLQALMRYTRINAHEVLHIGDRFTDSGNDSAARSISSILWVANPEETGFFIKLLLRDIQNLRSEPAYIE